MKQDRLDTLVTTIKRGHIRRLLQCFVFRFVLPAMDSAILWCFEWKRKQVVAGMTHYKDPLTGDLWLRDKAIEICESRARRGAG